MPRVTKAISRKRWISVSKRKSSVFLEDLRVELEGGLGAGIPGLFDFPDHFDRFLGMAALVALEVDLSIAADLHLAPLRQRIDRRDAHAVQTARDLVAAAAELAAGVQFGHDHFQGGFLLGWVHIHRDAAPVVGDGDRRIGVDDDFDAVAHAGQGLVDRVVHHFIDEVVQSLDVGAAHVHARAAPDGLQSFQDLDIFCVITSVGCHKFL